MQTRFAGIHADLAIALGWLTRLPVRFPPEAANRNLARALWAFPFVGVVLAAAVTAVFAVLTGLGANQLLAAAVAVATGILLTGALHEDGLADMLDGLGARGDRGSRLAAMRDSRIGTYGTIGLIVVILARVAALSSLTSLETLAALLAAFALGRAGMALVMVRLPLARSGGAAASAGKAGIGDVRKAAAFAVLVTLLASRVGDFTVLHLLLAVGLALTVALAVAWLADRRFGGYTGDVLGATCMAVETVVLLAWSMSAG